MMKSMRWSLGLVALVLLVPAALAACGSSQPSGSATEVPKQEASPITETGKSAAGNTLRVRIGAWPDSLQPQKASFSNEIAVLAMNYEGLTALDKDLKTVPGAASGWEYNSDASVITFTLRDGLTYSDGSPLVATDFVSAVYRTLDPNSPGDYQTSLDMIKGAGDIIGTEVPTDSAKLPDLYKALGVSAPDDKTIVFNLTKPTPYFHTLGSLWVMYPVKQSLIDAGGENWWETPANQLGNGPYQLTAIDKSNNLIEYKANENFHEGRPKVDTVQLKFIEDASVAFEAYKAGEIDILEPDPNDLPTIRADEKLKNELKEYAGACTYGFTFNQNKPPFDKKEVREAFAYGFDRKTYITDGLKDTEAETLTWIPPGYPGYDSSETRYAFDPAKGKEMLAAAGYPDGKGLPEIKITYSSSNPANQARAQLISQLYKQNLNVDIGLDPVEATTLTSLRKSNDTYPQMTRGGWCADYPDPQNWLSIYWGSGTNFAKNTGYKNAEVDKLMNEADVETDPTARAAKYAEAQKMVIGDSPYVFMSNSKNIFLINPRATGFDFTPQDSEFPGQETGLINVTISE